MRRCRGRGCSRGRLCSCGRYCTPSVGSKHQRARSSHVIRVHADPQLVIGVVTICTTWIASMLSSVEDLATRIVALKR